MFQSFFPNPRLFFPSAIAWAVLAVVGWYTVGDNFATVLGLETRGAAAPVIGIAMFWTPQFVLSYLYFGVATGLFFGFWRYFAPHRWSHWSILGSCLILFATYFQVQVSVAINSWYGPFYDLVQAALSKSRPVTLADFNGYLLTFAGIAFVAVIVYVLTRFFVSHFIFRWRAAMNDYYMANWPRLRMIDGAAQRVQEDTMRFSQITEGLELADDNHRVFAGSHAAARRDSRQDATGPSPISRSAASTVAARRWSSQKLKLAAPALNRSWITLAPAMATPSTRSLCS